MNAPDLYDRVKAACCPWHGFSNEAEYEGHIRRIVERILEVRGLLPRSQRAA